MLYSNHNGLTICAYNVIIYAWCLIQKEQHLTPFFGLGRCSFFRYWKGLSILYRNIQDDLEDVSDEFAVLQWTGRIRCNLQR